MAISRHNTDGRIARGERTREAIVAAHTELLREGVLKPTGKVIAERAGISLRTLWLNFKDLEGLLEATTAYWLRSDQELRRPIDPGLPLVERIELFCAQRVRRLENLAPAASSAVLGEPFSPVLQKSRRRHVELVWRDVEEAFAPEIEVAGEDRKTLTEAVYVAVSSPAWNTLRRDLGLGIDDAAAAMRYAIEALLAA